MERMIAYCGLDCTACEAYLATQADDDAMRAEVARKTAEQFGVTVEPSQINCDGCLATSDRKIGFCNVCQIRACAVERKLANCGLCPDYHCDKLDMIHAHSTEARQRLDNVKAGKPA